MRNPSFDDAPSEFEQKKQKAAVADSKWKNFVNSAPVRVVSGYAEGLGQAFTGPGSIGSYAAKGFRAGTGVLQRNPAAAEVLKKTGQYVLAPTILAAENAQQLIEFESKQSTEFKKVEREITQKQYEEIKKRDPNNPLLKDYEKELAKPLPEAIESPEDTVTALTNFYDTYHENAAQYLLSKNPDVIASAKETNQSVWDAAEAYSKEISFGQSAFDLIATKTNQDSMFDIDITDVEQRNYMFYEGDGIVGQIGKKGSGSIDLALQLFGDPFWAAGKGVTLFRLGVLNPSTVAEASMGIRRPWQQNYFVEGKEGVAKYNATAEKYGSLNDEIIALQQERNTWQLERDLYRAQIDTPNPGQVVDVESNLFNIKIADEQMAKLDTEIDAKRTAIKPFIPQLTRGHDEFHNQLPNMTLNQIIELPRFERYGAMRTRLAEAYYLAAKTGDKRDLIDLDLIAMGIDGAAADRLRQRSASLFTIIEDQKVVLKEFTDYAKLQLGELDSAGAKKVIEDSQANAYKLYEAYLDQNALLKAAVAQNGDRSISIVGMLDPSGVSRSRTIEKVRANRAKGKADLVFDDYSFTGLGRSVFVGRPLYGATERYRPNNMVTIDGIDQADGYDELTAWLQGARNVRAGERTEIGGFYPARVLGTEQAEKISQDFLLANTRAKKQEVLRQAERLFLKEVLTKLKVTLPEGKQGEEMLDSFIDEWLVFKDEQTSILRQKGFYTSPTDDLVTAPLLKTELAYSYYMADSTALAKWAKDNVPELNKFFKDSARALAQGTDINSYIAGSKNALYILDQMWRFGVLARLGYPVRNVGAEWLKFAVVGGMFRVFGPQYTTGSQIPKAVQKSAEAWFSNKHAYLQRLSLRAEVRKDTSYEISMSRYPDYVQMNNHLREGEIKGIIGEMEYNDFVKLAEEALASPEAAQKFPESLQDALVVYSDIVDSQKKLVDITERWNAAQKIERRTGYMQVYGYEFEQAYFGTQGAAVKNALSSGATTELMTSGVIGQRKSKNWMGVNAIIQPGDAEYFPNLSKTITNDYVNSEAAKEVLRVSILPTELQEAAREEVVQKFVSDAALNSEIMETGRYQFYKETIKAEQKDLASELKAVEEKTKKLIVLSDDDLETLNNGRLPEKFGPASPEYIKAVKAEKKRLTDEFQMDPDYVQKVEMTGGELGLSSNGKDKLAKQGLISVKAIKNAIARGRLDSDEISAMLSTGNIESVSVNGIGHEMYRFYTIAEIEALSVRTKNGMYFQVPWAQTGAEDYVSYGLRNFENNYYATRVEDLLTEHELRTDAITRLSALRKQIKEPENLSVEELLELGIKDFDQRTIQERYFDDIFEVVTRYLPDNNLRAEVLKLKVGEVITPEKLRLILSRSGQPLRPIAGDLLTSEERYRALAFKFADDYRTPQGVIEQKLDDWLLRRTKQEKDKFVPKTAEEAIRAEEAAKRLAAFDENITFGVAFSKFRTGVFRLIGQIPEDNLVKWPFGGTVYNQHIEKIARNWYKSGFEPTQADLYALHTAARARAISESRKYLYSAQRKLSGPGNVPFLAPFYQAAVIGSKNWARVAWNDPSIIARRVWMYNYINEHADYDKRNGNRTLTVRLPGWLIDSIETLPGNQSAYKNALHAFPNMKFNVNSFNLMFPGMRLGETGELQPNVTSAAGSVFEAVVSSIGAGPLVTMGVEAFVRANPNIDQDYYDLTGKVRPIRSVLDKIAPTENITADPRLFDALPPLAKRLYAGLRGVDSSEYARINMYLFMTYVHRMETGEMERIPLTDLEAQVANETAAMIGIKAMANFTLPAIPQFEGEVHKMVNIYREYQDTHKEKAFAEFVEDYPDWYVVASTMSKNDGGVLSTIDSQNMIENNKELVDRISAIGGLEGDTAGVKFLGAIANREGAPTEFDPASRVYLIDKEIYGRYKKGSSAVQEAMVQKGNNDYFKRKDLRDSQIKVRGQQINKPNLSSRNTSDPVVNQLNTDFDNWVNAQFEQNPEWWISEWEPKQNGKIQPSAIRAFRMALADEKWMSSQEPGNWTRQLKRYVDAQDEYSKLYESATSSNDKALIKYYFQQEIDSLVAANETFALYYDRFLEGANKEPFLQFVPEGKD